MALLWRDEMSIDRGLIDNDHKYLIGLVNDVVTIGHGPELSPRVAAILARLDAYAQSHFEREEQLQSAVAFPYMQAHHHRHVALMSELGAMRVEWDIVRTPKDIIAFHGQLCNFLNHWLIDHILKHDLRMRPFVGAMRRHAEGIAPLEEVVQ